MRTNEENQNMKINGKNQMTIKFEMIKNKIMKKPETLVAVHTHTHTHTHILPYIDNKNKFYIIFLVQRSCHKKTSKRRKNKKYTR